MKMKVSFITSVLTLLMGINAHAAVSLCVKNTTAHQRNEVVAFCAKDIWKQLGVQQGTGLVVRNMHRLEVTSQLTHHGQLLVEAAVQPGGTARFTVEAGTPRQYRSYVDGYYSHWRADDFTWENDLCAYRAYGPALQRGGEKAFGFDVWVKSTDQLDVRRRYDLHREACKVRDELNRQGKKAEAEAAFNDKSFHLDHGRGLDCYSVGPSLGCGTPAIMQGDSILMPWCYERYDVLDNGPLRLTFSLVYPKVNINGSDVVEHRIISIDKGSHFNKMTVWYEGLKNTVDVAGGFVVHDDKPENLILSRDFIAYSDPTDNAEKNNFEIYVGVLFPDGADRTAFIPDSSHRKQGIVGNAVGVRRSVENKEKVVYWFGASWCKSGTPDKEVWLRQISRFLDDCRNPLIMEIG